MSLFSKTFKIKNVQKEFDNVSRIICNNLEIDVHDTFFDFYNDPSDEPNYNGKEFSVELIDNPEKNSISLRVWVSSEINNHDYSMHGTIFKISDNSINVSFGGLLMKLTGIKLDKDMIDKNIYCLINIK